MEGASTNDAARCTAVFGFNCLWICPPFWSCEGHKYPDGLIQWVLQGRFSTRSHAYPRLIDDWLTRGMSGSGSCATGA
jgi:hypothetical protein